MLLVEPGEVIWVLEPQFERCLPDSNSIARLEKFIRYVQFHINLVLEEALVHRLFENMRQA